MPVQAMANITATGSAGIARAPSGDCATPLSNNRCVKSEICLQLPAWHSCRAPIVLRMRARLSFQACVLCKPPTKLWRTTATSSFVVGLAELFRELRVAASDIFNRHVV